MNHAVESHERQKAADAIKSESCRQFLAAGGSRLAAVFTILMLLVTPLLTPSGGGLAYAQAVPVPVGSVWKIERYSDNGVPIPTYGLIILPGTSTTKFGPTTTIIKFTAKYVSIPITGITSTSDTSTFVGEIAIREGEAIHIRQSLDLSGYIAFHSGLKIKEAYTYKGRYYDDAGDAGYFFFSRIR